METSPHPTVMELTSYYDTVFYASSVTPGGWQYPEKYPEYPSKYPEYPQYSPATPPPTPLSPPYTPSPAAASSVPGAEAAEAAASPSFAFSPSTSPGPHRTSSSSSRLPKIPPLEVLQQRRLAANARERKRANKINFAFARLRRALPGFTEREISKFEAIQLARDYIAQLSQLLEAADRAPDIKQE